MINRKVVIIDDDRKHQGEIESILNGSGYSPIVVTDALLAVDKVVESKPDVVLIELNMQQKSGLELAYKIGSVLKKKSIPIIAMSTYKKDGLGPLFDFCGIVKYIKKPIQPLDIIWAIEDIKKKKKS